MCGSMGVQERGKRPTIGADLPEGDEDSNFSVFRARRFHTTVRQSFPTTLEMGH